MKSRILLFFSCLPFSLLAQYTTPNNGDTFNLNDLVLSSNGTVTGGPDTFVINDSLTIAPMDTLLILVNPTVHIATDVLIIVKGTMEVFGNALFTRVDSLGNYKGFRFEEGSVINMEGPEFEYGGGLRALTGDLQMVDCIVRFTGPENLTGAALNLSMGTPLISNCTFSDNITAAIGSAANGEVAPTIINCDFIENNTANVNKPQINLGPSGADTIRIINNLVLGNPDNTMAGGIAISTLFGGECNAVITGNEVRDNRYGIAAIGSGITSRIEGNIIEENNSQGDPLLGGSGININASTDNMHTILDNQIRGNLWGITLQGNGMANLGEYNNEEVGAGGNIFSDNGNNGQTYALYNNTPNTIYAEGNCWLGDSLNTTLVDVENVIFDVADDNTLGQVIYDNEVCGTSGVDEVQFSNVATIYPNPTSGKIRVELSKSASEIQIMDLSGRLLSQKSIVENLDFSFDLSNLASGIYLVRLTGKNYITTGRVVVE